MQLTEIYGCDFKNRLSIFHVLFLVGARRLLKGIILVHPPASRLMLNRTRAGLGRGCVLWKRDGVPWI